MARQAGATGPSGVHDESALRQMPLRLLGYANEVGEAFKMFLSKKLYLGTYAVASAYCLADAGLHGHEAVAHRYPARPPWPGHPSWVGTTAFADAALWQGMASVVIPGFTINRLVAAATKLLANPAAPSNPTVRRWLPTIVGLGAIPFIVHPIDTAVDAVLDNTFRVATKGVEDTD